MNLAVARINAGSADDNNYVRKYLWFIFWISGIILKQVLYNTFLSSVKYVHLYRKCVYFFWQISVLGLVLFIYIYSG